MKTTIIGGGIGGLTTAIALKNKGIDFEIFEAAASLQPVGAGIALAQNAMLAFDHLGIASAILPLGQRLGQFALLKKNGKPLSNGNFESFEKPSDLGSFAIHRAALHEALLAQLPSQAIHLNKRVRHFVHHPDGVTLHFTDGSHHTASSVIAADGIHSPIRAQIYPQIQPQYAGYTCWRAVVQAPKMIRPFASETWGRPGRFGIVPLPNGQVYWFACVNAPEKDPVSAAFTLKDLQSIFADFHPDIPKILAATPAEALLHNDISDLPALPHYAHGRIVLLGDAAHATTPNMGQGACQAIEDAVFLAEEMAKHPDPQAAFKAFEQKRMERTQGIVKRSRQLGAIAQSTNPLIIGLRNTLMRITPPSVQAKQLKKVLEIQFG